MLLKQRLLYYAKLSLNDFLVIASKKFNEWFIEKQIFWNDKNEKEREKD
jgi:hypothetical protein